MILPRIRAWQHCFELLEAASHQLKLVELISFDRYDLFHSYCHNLSQICWRKHWNFSLSKFHFQVLQWDVWCWWISVRFTARAIFEMFEPLITNWMNWMHYCQKHFYEVNLTLINIILDVIVIYCCHKMFLIKKTSFSICRSVPD